MWKVATCTFPLAVPNVMLILKEFEVGYVVHAELHAKMVPGLPLRHGIVRCCCSWLLYPLWVCIWLAMISITSVVLAMLMEIVKWSAPAYIMIETFSRYRKKNTIVAFLADFWAGAASPADRFNLCRINWNWQYM